MDDPAPISDATLLRHGIRVLANMLLHRGATEDEILDAIGDRAARLTGLAVDPSFPGTDDE